MANVLSIDPGSIPFIPPSYDLNAPIATRDISLPTITTGEAPGGSPAVIVTPPPSRTIFTQPVLVGAGVGYLARGVTGAIIGAILGSFWKR